MTTLGIVTSRSELGGGRFGALFLLALNRYCKRRTNEACWITVKHFNHLSVCTDPWYRSIDEKMFRAKIPYKLWKCSTHYRYEMGYPDRNFVVGSYRHYRNLLCPGVALRQPPL